MKTYIFAYHHPTKGQAEKKVKALTRQEAEVKYWDNQSKIHLYRKCYQVFEVVGRKRVAV